MNEVFPVGGETIGEDLGNSNGFDEIYEEYGKKPFEDFRAEIDGTDNIDMPKFDLTPFGTDEELNNGYMNNKEGSTDGSEFDLSPIESIENGAFVSEEEEPVLSEDNFEERFDLSPLESDGDGFAEVNGDDVLENQVKSPENGSPLEKTDIPGVMRSKYDDILYHVSENGEIEPLKSPTNGNSLGIAGNGTFVDEATGQYFSIDDFKNK